MHSRSQTRYNRTKKINRKMRILKGIGGNENVDAWTGGGYGRLSKNKIHCSCPLCRSKTQDSMSLMDRRNQMKMEADLKDYEQEGA